MTSHQDPSGPQEAASGVPPEIAAEAAVWIARLHGPSRTAAMERECRNWQARSAVHRLAFERCTEIWEAVPQVSLSDAYASAALPQRVGDLADRAARRSRRGWLGSGLLVLTAVVGVAFHGWHTEPTYLTDIGEQRSVVLADGTRLSLNTDTRVDVNLGSQERRVTVLGGEALFEIAKDARRPFVVRVAGSEVVARGTAFAVRFTASEVDGQRTLAVTLLQGQASVRPAKNASRDAALANATARQPASAGDPGAAELRRRDGDAVLAPAREVQLQPGERLRLAPSCDDADVRPTLTLDHPRLEQLTAWKRSEVVLDDMSLAEAIGEMNRYSTAPLVLEGEASLARLRVSGTYRAGDSAGFARAVAALHGLRVMERPGRLALLRPQ